MLRIHRKGYHRKGYIRKGKYVRPTHVGGTTFLAKDRGKRGRTPKQKRWFETSGGTLGKYEVKQPESIRHKEIRKADKKFGTVKIHHHLLGLANVTADKKAEKIFKKDLIWTDKNLLNKKEGRRLTSKARERRKKRYARYMAG